MVTTYTDFYEAEAQVGDGQQVAQVLLDLGSPPLYFVVPASASADDMRAMSFELKYGKPMDAYQRWCIDQAKAQA